MNTYIALLRGVNVGGKNVLLMKDLALLLGGMGFADVQTYIQSGNVVFHSKGGQNNRIAKDISSRILETHGVETKVFLFKIAELREVVKNNPFGTEEGKALHFFFLESQPQSPDLERLRAIKSTSEDFKLGKNVFYLYAPDGVGRSKLAANVEQSMGVPVTARNWNTVSKLIVMATRTLGAA